MDERIAARLEKMLSYPQNWDSYGGVPPNVDLVNLVRSLLTMHEFPQPTHVGADGAGNIHLSYSDDDLNVEVCKGKILVLDSRGPDWLEWPVTEYRTGVMDEYVRLQNDLTELLTVPILLPSIP